MYNYKLSTNEISRQSIEYYKRFFNSYNDIKIRERGGYLYIDTTTLYCVIFNLLGKLHRQGKVKFYREEDKERLEKYMAYC